MSRVICKEIKSDLSIVPIFLFSIHQPAADMAVHESLQEGNILPVVPGLVIMPSKKLLLPVSR